MPTYEQKLNNFLNTINEDAQKIKSNIEKETKKFNQDELMKAEKEAMSETYELISQESAEITADIKKKYSSLEMDEKKKLFKAREEIFNSIFDDVIKKVSVFVSSSDYEKFLKDTASNVADKLTGSNVLYIRKEDESFAQELMSIIGTKEFVTDKSIALGGLKVYNKEKNVFADETLDTRMDLQKTWFIKNAGLQIKEV